jgi:hypothetical protein
MAIVQKQAKRFNQQPTLSVNAGTVFSPAENFNAPNRLVEVGSAYKPVDLTFNFIRSLFLDKIVENPVLLDAFLTNQVTDIAELEAFSKITYTHRFQSILERL